MGNDDFQWGDRWVFPLVPTACAYAKLNEYFGKLRGGEIEVLQAKSDFGENLSVRKVSAAESTKCKVKWRGPKTAIPEMKEMPQNPLLRVANTFAGCYEGGDNTGKLREIGNSAL